MNEDIKNNMTDTPHFNVAIAIIEHQNRFLISKRQPGSYMPGIWEFPGGKCEENEEPEATLTRELFEEIGIKPITPSFFQKIDHDYPGRTVSLYFYWVECFEGEPHGKEGQEVRWVKRDDLSQYTFPPANEQVLSKLLKTKT